MKSPLVIVQNYEAVYTVLGCFAVAFPKSGALSIELLGHGRNYTRLQAEGQTRAFDGVTAIYGGVKGRETA